MAEEGKSKYALAGVDFAKEDSVVAVMKAGYRATKPFVADVQERLGFTLPGDIGSFSDAMSWSLETAVRNGVKKVDISTCADGSGSEPIVHQVYTGNDEEKRACTGIDAAAMVANDMICGGARPVLLLNYVAWHDPNIEMARDLQSGLVIGCRQAGAVNIGGENASLSAMITGAIPKRAYDICAFGVGFVLEPHLLERPLDGSRLKEGDDIIGVASSGLHCNGLTLVWKTVIDFANCGFAYADRLNQHDEMLGETPADAILTPTIIYKVPVLDNVLANSQLDVKAVVNVTGGGVKNDLRPLKTTGLSAELDFSKVDVHPVFGYVQKKAGVPVEEMLTDYNMGVGMRIYADSASADGIIKAINATEVDGRQMKAFRMGKVVKGSGVPLVSAIYKGQAHDYS